MKYIKVYNLLVVLALTSFFYQNYGINDADNYTHQPATIMPVSRQKNRTADQQSLSFSFKEEPLVDIIAMVARARGNNIILPAGADAITSKVTLQIDTPLSISAAWDMLQVILDAAGYSIVLRGSMYAIVKNSKTLIKEPVPLYINVPADQLPDTDQHIRYLYYLANIKITEEPNSELDAILHGFLSDSGTYKTDLKTNGILLIDKANNIKSAMKAIGALDQTTFRERFEPLKLHYVNAEIVAQLFESDLFRADREPQRYGRDKRTVDDASYFSRQVRVIAEPRTNSLFILGREQAVMKVKKFIQDYIDTQPESGKSILHVYQLQYLDAAEFAPVLDNIVKSSRYQGTGQSAAEQKQAGSERFFEGVIIKTDKPLRSDGGDATGAVKYSGGNKLIIAAKNDDWKIIKPLIEDLDKPQRTVILEVLIVDLTADDARLLGTSLRNPLAIPFPNGGVSMQTVHVTPEPILYHANSTPPLTIPTSTLATDLLLQPSLPSSNPTTNFAAIADANSTLVSLNDSANGQTWGIVQLLQNFVHSKILSHPHVVATNNRTAEILVGEQRLLQGEAVSAVAPVVKNELQDANLKVKITPRIGSSDSVSLKVFVDITEYILGPSNARITRNFETIAEVHTGSVLALGGLIRVDTAEGLRDTPILSRIPILGWFFKRRTARNIKTNLTVFISPTIVEPRLRSGVGEYTLDHLGIAQRYIQEGELFDGLRDPITRFFFKPIGDDNKMVREFLV
jgi:general secretion pathway protein D